MHPGIARMGPSMRVSVVLSTLAVLSLASSGRVHAAPEGSRLYAPCGTCHAPQGWGSMDGAIPNLAGQHEHYLEKQLAMYRSGSRVDPSMQVVAMHSTSKRDTVALAVYLSALDSNPHPVFGAGDHLRVGQELYTHICAACHGADGLGDAANRVPRIGGQHYPYLKQQITAAAALHRDLAPPEMTSALRGMQPQEKDALADFVSRLGHAEALLDSSRPF